MKWMMVHLMLVASVLCLLSGSATAQDYLDIVQTKDGSTYKGKIVEQVPQQYIKIQLKEWKYYKNKIF